MSKFLILLLLSFAFASAPVRRADVVLPEPHLALDRVAVVDVERGRILPDQTVLIAGERIVQVTPSGSSRIPSDAQVVNATGKFLIPGLWTCISTPRTSFGPASPTSESSSRSSSHGVLGVRGLVTNLEDLANFRRWRDEITARERIGPWIAAASPVLDGSPPVYPTWSVPVPEGRRARSLVDSPVSGGVESLKIYELLSRDAYLAIEAKGQGLTFAGHVPFLVSAGEASDAGQKSMEHLRNVLYACSWQEKELRSEAAAILSQQGKSGSVLRSEVYRALNRKALDTYDDAKCQVLLGQFARNRTWQTPTLVTMAMNLHAADTSAFQDSRLRYVPQAEREAWVTPGRNTAASLTPAIMDGQRSWCDAHVRLLRDMRAQGVRFLTGTDSGGGLPFLVPGFALHQELEALAQAGVPPEEILRAATLNAATYLGLDDSLGAIEPGKAADLVLLDSNPLDDIRNPQRIQAVVTRGRYLDRRGLDGLLTEAERAADTPSG